MQDMDFQEEDIVDEPTQLQQQGIGGRFGAFGFNYLNRQLAPTWHNAEGDDKETVEILYGGKHVTQWPYDDYHLVQQQYYVKLEELALKSESKDEDTDHTNFALPSVHTSR